jgi:hypothetical protein
MTFEIIEPTQKKMSGAVYRRQIAQQAHQCARWLRVNGFEVMAVLGGLRQPRVVIKSSPLCNTLDGVVQAYERTSKGERRYRYAVRFDCMIEWEAA